MDFLIFLQENTFLVSSLVTVLSVQVTQYFTVKRHTAEIKVLQEAHDQNRKLIENIIRMEKDIQYIVSTIDKLERRLDHTT
jgi:hypothetical protein